MARTLATAYLLIRPDTKGLAAELVPAAKKAGTQSGKGFAATTAAASTSAGRNVGKTFANTLAPAGTLAGRSVGKTFSGQTIQMAGKGGKTAGQRFHSGIKGATSKLPAMLGGLFVVAAAGRFFKSVFEEAREAAKINRITESTIRATGGAANVSAEHVSKMSERLSNMAGVDDDLIQTGANLLLTFKGVRNEAGKGNDIFDQSSAAILDMTSAMNNGVVTQEGLKSSTLQVGKALNDPIKGITALTRVGVTFTDQQKQQIKTMVENGDKMGAQKIILGELKSEFGGAAAAAADPAEKAKVAWGNFKEELGNKLMPIVNNFLTMLTTQVLPAVMSTVNWFGQHQAVTKTLGIAIAALVASFVAYKVTMAAVSFAGTAWKAIQLGIT